MSTRSLLAGRVDDDLGLRALSFAALLALTASYLVILYDAVVVAGDTNTFLLVVAASFVGAIVLGRYAPTVGGVAVALVLGAAGTYVYLTSNPSVLQFVDATSVLLADVVALLTGLSILRIVDVGTWAIAFAPVPVFLSWFLAAQRRYVAGTTVGCAALGFFVLTGDAGLVTALLGVLAAAAVVGFGDLHRLGGGLENADAVAFVLALMVVLTVTVGLVPGGAGSPILRSGASGGDSLETSLTSAEGQITIQGAISLSPEVRYTVRSGEQQYWRVASYNRFTGNEWLRTTSNSGGTLDDPPGQDRAVRQRFTAESSVNTMPAAWRPVQVDGYDYTVTGFGGLQPVEPLSTGDSYRVTSRVSNASPEDLRSAGTDYPENFGPYLETGGLDPRVGEFTDTLTANADNPYDTARVIEVWLQENKRYSLDVQRPSGHVAEEFLFEMEAGYCTYYATTMVMMLRTQGIPARFVVGYTPGEQVDANEYVVRGLDSHAWVEAYFPGHGWVRFDPTPAGPRQDAEQQTLEQARSQGAENVDTSDSEPTTTTTTTTTTDEGDTNTTATNGTALPTTDPFERGIQGGGGGAATTTDDGGLSLPDPSREQVLLGAIVLFGLAAGARRSGFAQWTYREVWLRRQPRTDDPQADIERAFERLEYMLGRLRRERRPGETPRQYLQYVSDDRAKRVGELYERAVYRGDATERMADEAVRLVDELVDDREQFGR